MPRSTLRRHFPTFDGIWPRLRALRLPRPRHKARWAAGLVVAGGLTLVGIAAQRYLDAVAHRYTKIAEGHVGRCLEARREADSWASRMAQSGGEPDEATFDAYADAVRLRSYHHNLAAKYYIAATRPWLPIDPDPPPPE